MILVDNTNNDAHGNSTTTAIAFHWHNDVDTAADIESMYLLVLVARRHCSHHRVCFCFVEAGNITQLASIISFNIASPRLSSWKLSLAWSDAGGYLRKLST